eukprot:3141229-Amphidinium_carterae.1
MAILLLAPDLTTCLLEVKHKTHITSLLVSCSDRVCMVFRRRDQTCACMSKGARMSGARELNHSTRTGCCQCIARH